MNNTSVDIIPPDRENFSQHQRNTSLSQPAVTNSSEYQQKHPTTAQLQIQSNQSAQGSSSTTTPNFRPRHGQHSSLSSIPSSHYSPTRNALSSQSVFHSPSRNSWQGASPSPYFPPPQNAYTSNNSPASPSTSVHQIIQFHHWQPNQQKSTTSPKKDGSINVLAEEPSSIKRRKSVTVSSDRTISPSPTKSISTTTPSASGAMVSASAYSRRRGMHSRNKSETSVLRGDSLSRMSLYSSPSASASSVSISSLSRKVAEEENGDTSQSSSLTQGTNQQPQSQNSQVIGPHSSSLHPAKSDLYSHITSESSKALINATGTRSPIKTNSNVDDPQKEFTKEDSRTSLETSVTSPILVAPRPRLAGKGVSGISSDSIGLKSSSSVNSEEFISSNANFRSYSTHSEFVSTPVSKNSSRISNASGFNFLASVAADSQRLEPLSQKSEQKLLPRFQEPHDGIKGSSLLNRLSKDELNSEFTYPVRKAEKSPVPSKKSFSTSTNSQVDNLQSTLKNSQDNKKENDISSVDEPKDNNGTSMTYKESKEPKPLISTGEENSDDKSDDGEELSKSKQSKKHGVGFIIDD
ncbi:uncharacterized protein SAPINGB_P003863 [Magnusiomyces paraingens]|uniref:Uncharacterized protein n=1 Tax=Magnusiomyces paraingens TaxID=2606893 RepID=A0A5E8BRM6_9ASCO|nr:uncharacterized protein SAPINGB_P003863 [Saprochaete ingens]VVT54013.1 unnamed protein product [Saprochaete ingens]